MRSYQQSAHKKGGVKAPEARFPGAYRGKLTLKIFILEVETEKCQDVKERMDTKFFSGEEEDKVEVGATKKTKIWKKAILCWA